jgi:CBS domain-containing protein
MELARNLMVESVSRLTLAPTLCLCPDQTVSQAVEQMRQAQVGYVLICRGGRLVGIFTERDLMRRVLAPARGLDLPLDDVLTRPVVVVSPRESISMALRRMEQGGYRHLPVIEANDRPIGVLSVKRIVQYLVEHFPSTICNLPPDPSVFPREAEGA